MSSLRCLYASRRVPFTSCKGSLPSAEGVQVICKNTPISSQIHLVLPTVLCGRPNEYAPYTDRYSEKKKGVVFLVADMKRVTPYIFSPTPYHFQ